MSAKRNLSSETAPYWIADSVASRYHQGQLTTGVYWIQGSYFQGGQQSLCIEKDSDNRKKFIVGIKSRTQYVPAVDGREDLFLNGFASHLRRSSSEIFGEFASEAAMFFSEVVLGSKRLLVAAALTTGCRD